VKVKKTHLNNWPYPWVLIVWRDPTHNTEWSDEAEVRTSDSSEVYTVGWIREQTADHIKVCSSLILDDKVRSRDSSDIFSIPMGCVSLVKYLKTNGKVKEEDV
jgi:hypothetical protein